MVTDGKSASVDIPSDREAYIEGGGEAHSPNEYEEARLRALQDLELLDTPESESFDRITRMASRLFHTPVSAVSLTDRHRQWFKSHVGTQGREIVRTGAPCAEVTSSREALVIPDMLEDSRYSDCLLAQSGVRFYAGAPLTTRDGYVLGAMCVLDQKPRKVSDDELASLQDFAAMVMSQIELQHDFGRIDPLSGLPNRHQFTEDLLDLKRDDPDGQRVAVLIDLAESRQFNQAVNVLGTDYIDDLAKNSSHIIKEILGRSNKLYQVSITSFLALLDENGGEKWQEVVYRLSTRLKTPLLCKGVPVAIHIAFGISPFRLCDSGPHDVLRTAMSAVHDARQAEIECALYNPASDEANRRRFALLTDIPQALEQQDQFTLVYQPRIDVRTGVCVSAEALLRWCNPELGNVSPGEFIPLVEETALARPVTQWVIKAALDQAAQWLHAGIDIRISINISARNLEEQNFARSLAEALQRHNVPAKSIELEFTESALIRNRSQVLAQLEEVRHMGVELAIDDFGTGYSTLSYLHKLPATTVKIDQSFIRGLEKSARDQTLVRSIIAMAHDMGYHVVAEGVETAEAYKFLADSGCDEVQGYFFSRPLPVSSFETWLRQRRDNQIVSMLNILQRGTELSVQDAMR